MRSTHSTVTLRDCIIASQDCPLGKKGPVASLHHSRITPLNNHTSLKKIAIYIRKRVYSPVLRRGTVYRVKEVIDIDTEGYMPLMTLRLQSTDAFIHFHAVLSKSFPMWASPLLWFERIKNANDSLKSFPWATIHLNTEHKVSTEAKSALLLAKKRKKKKSTHQALRLCWHTLWLKCGISSSVPSRKPCGNAIKEKRKHHLLHLPARGAPSKTERLLKTNKMTTQSTLSWRRAREGWTLSSHSWMISGWTCRLLAFRLPAAWQPCQTFSANPSKQKFSHWPKRLHGGLSPMPSWQFYSKPLRSQGSLSWLAVRSSLAKDPAGFLEAIVSRCFGYIRGFHT